MAPHQLYFVGEVFIVGNKSSLTLFCYKRFQSKLLSFFCLKCRVLSKQELIPSSIVLVTVKKWLVLRNNLDYTDTNFRAKVQPHQPSVLIIYPTQLLKYF